MAWNGLTHSTPDSQTFLYRERMGSKPLSVSKNNMKPLVEPLKLSRLHLLGGGWLERKGWRYLGSSQSLVSNIKQI